VSQIPILESLGLSEKEALTYQAILELGSSTIKPVADRSGVKRSSIYNFIDRLVEMGLITQTTQRGRTHYQALPPSRLVDLQRERLSAVERALPQFMSMFNMADHKPRIHYFEGPEQIKNIPREEPLCHKEMLYIWPNAESTEMMGGKDFMIKIDHERRAAGVFIRCIRLHDPKENLFETSLHGTEHMRQIRFAPEGTIPFTMGMGIYDTGKVSLFSSAKENFGILIESKELEALMRVLFESWWEKCVPGKPGQG